MWGEQPPGHPGSRSGAGLAEGPWVQAFPMGRGLSFPADHDVLRMLPWWFRMLARWSPRGHLGRFQLLLRRLTLAIPHPCPRRKQPRGCILSSRSRCPLSGLPRRGPPSPGPLPSPAHSAASCTWGRAQYVNGRILASDRLETGHFQEVGGTHGLCPSGLCVPETGAGDRSR